MWQKSNPINVNQLLFCASTNTKLTYVFIDHLVGGNTILDSLFFHLTGTQNTKQKSNFWLLLWMNSCYFGNSTMSFWSECWFTCLAKIQHFCGFFGIQVLCLYFVLNRSHSTSLGYAKKRRSHVLNNHYFKFANSVTVFLIFVCSFQLTCIFLPSPPHQPPPSHKSYWRYTLCMKICHM